MYPMLTYLPTADLYTLAAHLVLSALIGLFVALALAETLPRLLRHRTPLDEPRFQHLLNRKVAAASMILGLPFGWLTFEHRAGQELDDANYRTLAATVERLPELRPSVAAALRDGRIVRREVPGLQQAERAAIQTRSTQQVRNWKSSLTQDDPAR